MAYFGRVLLVGETEKRRSPFVAYGVSGRSPPSRERKAVIENHSISIVPIGQITKEQQQQAALLLYNAILVSEREPLAVVSNGRHTQPVLESLRAGSGVGADQIIRLTEAVLNDFGPEDDKYHTPRIVGVVDSRTKEQRYYALGIIARDKEAKVGITQRLANGGSMMLTTYSGSSVEPSVPKFSAVWEVSKSVRMEGESAHELVSSLWHWMDPEFLVCTAAALWNEDSRKWDLAIRNNGP